MMRVYYDTQGHIEFTLKVEKGFEPQVDLAFIEVPDQQLNPMFWKVIEGELVQTDVLTDDLRSAFIERIQSARGEIRKLFITQLPGQDLVYMNKERQALAFLADPEADSMQYRAIHREVGITAPTAYEVAQVYLNKADLLDQASGVIEEATLGAIAIVEVAETVAEAEAAIASMNATLEAISGLA